MIQFQEFILDNGLRVIVHEDHTFPIAAVNLLYNVGSRDESPIKTGFAHLLEHLMFGGSKNIPVFDEHLQKVGGENNAFTTPDITSYYIKLPAINLETAFWLESDRMLGLSFESKILEVQRKVVVEEFKQRYLNQPYGDVWLKLRPLSYQMHPYQWPTIGKDISHILDATINDVKSFFNKFYIPNNAILVVAGDVYLDEVHRLAEKWFEPIPAQEKYTRNLPKEPLQHNKRTRETESDVPSDALYMTWHMCARCDKTYHTHDLLSDILGMGKASRLYQSLVKKEKIFNNISAHISGSLDPGLFIIQGQVKEGVSIWDAENAVLEVIENIKLGKLHHKELDKVKTQAETSIAFSEVEVLNRALNLAFFANLGDAQLYNLEMDKISRVDTDDVIRESNKILQENNLSVLYYKTKN